MRSGASAITVLLLAILGVRPAAAGEWPVPPAGYSYEAVAPCVADPVRAEKPARPGAAVYRLCSDQMQLFSLALSEARSAGKLLLVTFGATWCPSCAALQRRIKSDDMLGHAPETIDYAATFHHIEVGVSTTDKGRQVRVPSGEAVLGAVLKQAVGVKIRVIPFLAVIDPAAPERTYARNLDDLETAGGFDPARFRAVLTEAHQQVRKGDRASAEPLWITRKLLRWWNG